MCLNEWSAVVHLFVRDDPAVVDLIVLFDFVKRELLILYSYSWSMAYFWVLQLLLFLFVACACPISKPSWLPPLPCNPRHLLLLLSAPLASTWPLG